MAGQSATRDSNSDKLRKELEDLRHQTCFSGKKNCRSKVAYSKKLYHNRYRVENFFLPPQAWDLPVAAT